MIAHQGSLPERRSRKQSSQEKERLRKREKNKKRTAEKRAAERDKEIASEKLTCPMKSQCQKQTRLGSVVWRLWMEVWKNVWVGQPFGVESSKEEKG